MQHSSTDALCSCGSRRARPGKPVGEVKLNCSNDPTKRRGCKDMNGYRHVKFNFIEELTFKCNSGSYFMMLKFFIIKIIPHISSYLRTVSTGTDAT
jgi:hypothetical protein